MAHCPSTTLRSTSYQHRICGDLSESDVHLLALAIRGMRIPRVRYLAIVLLIHLIDSTRIRSRDLAASRCVTDWRKVGTNTGSIILAGRGLLSRVTGLTVDLRSSRSRPLSLLVSLALIVLLLLASLPFFSDLLKFYSVPKKLERR